MRHLSELALKVAVPRKFKDNSTTRRVIQAQTKSTTSRVTQVRTKSTTSRVTQAQTKSTTQKSTEPDKQASYAIDCQYFEKIESSYYENFYQAVYILENTGTETLYLGAEQFEVTDENGHLIGVESVSVYPKVVAPGEKAVFIGSFDVDEVPDGGLFLELKYTVSKATVPYTRFDVSDTSIKEDSYGRIKTLGRVRNTSDSDESICYVYVFFYGEDDKVLDVESTYVSLTAGETTAFEISTSTRVYSFSDIKRYEIISYPFQYQYD